MGSVGDPAPSDWPSVIGDGGQTASVTGLPGLVGSEVPDVMIDWGRIDGLEVRAASARGRSHRYKDTPRQDHFNLRITEDQQHLLIAVADGVSASPQSDRAARTACSASLEALGEVLVATPIEQVDWDEIIDAARRAVLDEARRVTADPRLEPRKAAELMATTLLLAAVDVPCGSDGERQCVVIALGDTSAWILREDRTWESMSPIKNEDNEIATSEVFALPLTQSTSVEPLVTSLGTGEVFFAFTDGIGDPLGDGTGIVGDVLSERWASPPSPYSFGSWVDFARSTHVDDRTAVGVWFSGVRPIAEEDVANPADGETPDPSNGESADAGQTE